MPATPKGELVDEIRRVLEEEEKGLSMSIREVEKSGIKLRHELFNPELTAGGTMWQTQLFDVHGRH